MSKGISGQPNGMTCCGRERCINSTMMYHVQAKAPATVFHVHGRFSNVAVAQGNDECLTVRYPAVG